MEYRREIDGLRALAVIPVMLFHAGFETFGGGFVGVDVFFVISGYLITTIILAELEQGRFSLVGFYERRARRILPALFCVMLVCIPFAWYWLWPADMKDFAWSLIAVSAFSSNILFWRESGYFETAAELKPLLHTWSLAVEEQFYLFFPVFLMVLWRFGKRWIVPLLGLVFMISLALANWAVHAKPDAAFYLLPTRGWELLVGVFAAFHLSRTDRRAWAEGLGEGAAWLGVALILYAIFNFNKATPFPGIHALVPTLGAVLIILFATRQTTAGRFVGHKAFVGIGLISYSAYLWHQPLFSFARHSGLGNHEKAEFTFLIVLALILAWLTWKFVETPFRNRSNITRRGIFVFGLLGSGCFVLTGFYVDSQDGEIRKLSSEQRAFLDSFDNSLPDWKYFTRNGISEKFREDCNFFDIPKYRAGNLAQAPRDSISSSCFTRRVEGSKTLFIWGDSHAQHLYHGLKETLPADVEILQVASSACVANPIEYRNQGDYCEYSNWFAFDSIKRLKPDYVIIGQNTGHDAREMKRISAALKVVGVGKVVFVGPSPHWTPSLPAVAARFFPEIPERTFFGVDKGVLEIDRTLRSTTANAPDFRYVSLIDYFCTKEGCLLYYDRADLATVTSWDYGHLTPTASCHLARDVLVSFITGQ